MWVTLKLECVKLCHFFYFALFNINIISLFLSLQVVNSKHFLSTVDYTF